MIPSGDDMNQTSSLHEGQNPPMSQPPIYIPCKSEEAERYVTQNGLIFEKDSALGVFKSLGREMQFPSELQAFGAEPQKLLPAPEGKYVWRGSRDSTSLPNGTVWRQDEAWKTIDDRCMFDYGNIYASPLPKTDSKSAITSLGSGEGSGEAHDLVEDCAGVQAAGSQGSGASPRVERLFQALQQIARWNVPSSGQFWGDGEPMSFEAAYGSNGVRDYFKDLARTALNEYVPETKPAEPHSQEETPSQPKEEVSPVSPGEGYRWPRQSELACMPDGLEWSICGSAWEPVCSIGKHCNLFLPGTIFRIPTSTPAKETVSERVVVEGTVCFLDSDEVLIPAGTFPNSSNVWVSNYDPRISSTDIEERT